MKITLGKIKSLKVRPLSVLLGLLIIACGGGATLPSWFVDFGNGYATRGYVFSASDQQSLYHMVFDYRQGQVALREVNLQGEVLKSTMMNVASYANGYPWPNLFYPDQENGVYVTNPDAEQVFYLNGKTENVWVGLDQSFVDAGKNLYIQSSAAVLGNALFLTGYMSDRQYFGDSTGCVLLKVNAAGEVDPLVFRDRCFSDIKSDGETILLTGTYNDGVNPDGNSGIAMRFDEQMNVLSQFEYSAGYFYVFTYDDDQILAMVDNDRLILNQNGDVISEGFMDKWNQKFLADQQGGYYAIRYTSQGRRPLLPVLQKAWVSHYDSVGNLDWSRELSGVSEFFTAKYAQVNQQGALELSLSGGHMAVTGTEFDLSAFEDNTEISVDLNIRGFDEAVINHHVFTPAGEMLRSVTEAPWVRRGVLDSEYSQLYVVPESVTAGHGRLFNSVFLPDGSVASATFYCTGEWVDCTHRLNLYR